MPMDIEWAKDGKTGNCSSCRPAPRRSTPWRSKKTSLEVYQLQEPGTVLLEGRSVGEKIGAGPARVVKNLDQLQDFHPGEVLVADMTDPDWEPTMKMAAAIVTNRGGRTCHAAIVSRELGVPCVVGTEKATALLHDGQKITVSCAEGEVGQVYDGVLKFSQGSARSGQSAPAAHARHDERRQPGPGVRPVLSAQRRRRPGPRGVHHLQRHPGPSPGAAALRLPARRAGQGEDCPAHRGFPDKPDYFVERLAEGVGQIAAAFYPKDVIVRLSDFKTNEYAGLLGGESFEPKEENPDDRLSRRFALLRRALPRGLPAGMPGHEDRCARRWG